MSIFKDCVFFVSTDVKNKFQITKSIKENGGTINFMVTKQVTHFVTVDREVQNQTTNVKKATQQGIHIVSDQFVLDCVEKSIKFDEKLYKLVPSKPQPKLYDQSTTSSSLSSTSSLFASPAYQSPKKVEPIPTQVIEQPKVFAPKAKALTKPSVPAAAGNTRRKILDSEDNDTNETEVSLNIPSSLSLGSFSSTFPNLQSYATPTFSFDINKFNSSNNNNITSATTISTATATKTSSSVSTQTDEFPLIPNPRTIKCELFTFGSPKEPQFPTNYKIVKTHTLQFTNIGANNNKYYILELHEGTSPSGSKTYRLYTNYGRTSGKATKESRYPHNLQDALHLYSSIYNEKTSDKKGYKPVSLNASKITSASDSVASSFNQGISVASTLPIPVQTLVTTLYSEATNHLTQSCSAHITENGIETPLGVLSLEQVEKGEKILDRLHAELKTSSPTESKLAAISSEFYTVIPHRMGRTKADIDRAVIRNMDQLSSKVDLLQLMKDLLKINQSSGGLSNSALDMKYHALKSNITHLSEYSHDYETVARLVRDTSADNPVSIKNIFKVSRNTEEESFNKNISPTKLLFHGSRPANFVGILSRGMLLPKVIVNNGGSRTDFGFLGAGIYFADKFSTSCLYAAPTASSPSLEAPSRFILVSEVAVGMVNKVTKINSTLVNPPFGYHSCLGVANNGYNNSDFKDNEYVVYNTNQQKQQYLVEFSFGGSDSPVIKTDAPLPNPSFAKQISFKPTTQATPALPTFETKKITSTPFSTSVTSVTAPPPGATISTNYNFAPSAVAVSTPATTVQASSSAFDEFAEETRYREMFASGHSVSKEKFLGLENVFRSSEYTQMSPYDISSQFVVMPFIRNQIYSVQEKRIVPSFDKFQENWKTFTNNMFGADFNWSNIFVAGGAVLKNTLNIPSKFEGAWKDSDIDIFFYDISEREATEKITTLYNYFKSKSPNIDVVRTKYAITFVNAKVSRNIQIVLRIYRSPAEILMGFDIDCCSVGYDGQNVYALPRARRAIINGINCISMTRRSLTYETRLFKYAKRGFGIVVPNYARSQIDKSIYLLPMDKTAGLARLMLLEYKYIHSFSGHIQMEEKSDYDNVEIPSGGFWTINSIINIINYKDKSQFFSKKQDFKHRHIAVTGFDNIFEGKSSWCKKCRAGESPSGHKDSDDNKEYVHGPITWVTQNPGRQLLTGSFHPVNDQQWAISAISPNSLSSELKQKVDIRFKSVLDQPISSMDSIKENILKRKTYNPIIAETEDLLHTAAAYGSLNAVKSLLPRLKSQINIPSDNGFYPIHFACIRGSVELVKLLIDNGALPQLRTKNYQKYSCLIIAQHFNNAEVVKYLLVNHPNLFKIKCNVPNKKSFRKWRVPQKEVSIQSVQPDENIFKAVIKCNIDATKKFLADSKCPLTDTIGNSLYHYAVLSSDPKLMLATLDANIPKSANLHQLKAQKNIFGQNPAYFVRMAMSSMNPLTYTYPGHITPRYVMEDLSRLLSQLPDYVPDTYTTFIARIPIHFLTQTYHHAASLPISASTPAATTTPLPAPAVTSNVFAMSKPAAAPAQTTFGVGGKFSPPSSPASIFGSTSPPKPNVSLFASSPAKSPQAPSLPTFSLPPVNAKPMIFNTVQGSPSTLQLPSTSSPNYPDFIRPGFKEFDQSSQVAKALVLISSMKNKFNDSEVLTLRTKALKLDMTIFNCIEAYQLDKSIDNLIESFKVCLKHL